MKKVDSNARSKVVNGKWNSTLLALSVALLIVAVTGVPAFAAGPAVAARAEFLIANPELKVAQRYVEIYAEPSQSAFLAANPELMVAQRYVPYEDFSGRVVPITVVPEYASPVVEVPDNAFLVENPELRVAFQHMNGSWSQ